MATRSERVDWETVTPGNSGPILGQSWVADISGSTPNQHVRVFVEIEEERTPSPEYYQAELMAQYPEVRLPAVHPFSEQVRLNRRKDSMGYRLLGATKELVIDLPGM